MAFTKSGDRRCIKPIDPIMPVKTLDIIYRRRFVPNTQYYFTNRKNAPGRVSLGAAFKRPRSAHLLAYMKFRDQKHKEKGTIRRHQAVYEKDGVRSALSRDISKRIYVEEPQDNVKAVVEIHPEFYRAVEGRPLRPADDIKVYITNIRNYTMYRQQIGYRHDLILKIASNISKEAHDFDNISKNLRSTIKNFQIFLTEDNKKANAKVEEAEKLHQVVQVRKSELLSLFLKIASLDSIIINLDTSINILKRYRYFLMHCAPDYWREQYDETYKKMSLDLTGRGHQMDSHDVLSIETDLFDEMDVDKLIEQFIVEFSEPKSTQMYYRNPHEMMYAFRSMELQSREYLIQLSNRYHAKKVLQKVKNKIIKQTEREKAIFDYFVDMITKEVEREKYNESYLKEKFMRILDDTFYDLVASPAALNMQVCTGYVYEQLFGKHWKGHDNLYNPARVLERFYEELNLQIDALEYSVVRKAVSDCFEQDIKMLQDAKLAQRQLKEFREMTNSMKRSFKEPAKFTRPPAKKFISKADLLAEAQDRKCRQEQSKRVKYYDKYKVSEEDYEDLKIFTEWCEGLDPAPYLEILEKYVRPAFQLSESTVGTQGTQGTQY